MFLALGRHGSLSAAARALSINHGTVARRIQSLESSLAEKLIERRADGYVLTPAGTRAMDAARQMEAAAQTLGRGSAEQPLTGLVRVNAPPGLGQGFLVEQLSKLPVTHPGLDIDLATDLRSISLERHQADIAVRVGPPPDGHFIVKTLGQMAFGYYGTDDVCRAVENGGKPGFISFDEENSDLHGPRWLARHFPASRIAFKANNHISQARAARAGVGLVLVPHYLGRQEPSLRRCRLGSEPPALDIWLLMRPRDREHQLIRMVAAHLQEAFERERGLFSD